MEPVAQRVMWKAFLEEWKQKSLKCRLYMIGGGFFLVLAGIGVFVPLIPQVPFAVLAALLFSRGSKQFHLWIRSNGAFGPAVRDWEDHHVIRPKLKVISTLAMVGGAGVAHWKLALPAPFYFDAAFALALLFVWTRKSRPHGWVPRLVT